MLTTGLTLYIYNFMIMLSFEDKWEPEAEQDNPKVSDAEEGHDESERGVGE